MMRRSSAWLVTLLIVSLAGCQYLIDESAPDVAITAPFGQTVAGDLEIVATVSDFDSGLKSAKIFVDGDEVFVENYAKDVEGRYQTTSDEISRTIEGLSPGDYEIMVEATNAFDLIGSDAKVVTVATEADQEEPTVAWIGPEDGDTVSGIVPFAVAASDDIGVVRVEFFAETTLLGTDDTAPYTLAWDTTDPTTGVGDGDVTIAARAVDAAGRIGRASIVVEVNNMVEPPALELVAPEADAEVDTQFTAIAEVTTVEGGFTWIPDPEDESNLWARVYDQTGALLVEGYMTSDGTDAGTEPADDQDVTVERDFDLTTFLGETPLEDLLIIVEGTVEVDGVQVRIADQAEFDVVPMEETP